MDSQYVQRIKVQAFMGALEIEVHGAEINQIVGKCADGKTSFLKAMEAVIGGARRVPSRPVTIGAEEGTVELETDDLEFVLVVSEDKEVKWACRGKEGGRYNRGDIDSMTRRLWADPTLWARKNKDEQLSDLLSLADPAWVERWLELQKELAQAKEGRLQSGRDLRALGDLPAEPPEAEVVDVVALSEQLELIRQHNAAQDKVQRALDLQEKTIGTLRLEISRLQERLVELEAQESEMPRPEPIQDAEPVRQRLATARETNAAAEARSRWVDRSAEHGQRTQRHRLAELEVQRLVDAQREQASTLELPVDGLRIDSEGVIFYRDLPFPEHVNEGEAILICAELIMAQSSGVKILLCQRGESLDDMTFQRLVELGRKYKVQVWIASGRMHGDGTEGQVIILSQGKVAKVDAPKTRRGRK
jgi:hypothetical protein